MSRRLGVALSLLALLACTGDRPSTRTTVIVLGFDGRMRRMSFELPMLGEEMAMHVVDGRVKTSVPEAMGGGEHAEHASVIAAVGKRPLRKVDTPSKQ